MTPQEAANDAEGPARSTTSSPLLEVSDLRTYFGEGEATVRAVDDVSLQIRAGETLGLVGESGSGKSVTSLTIMRLLDTNAQVRSGVISYLGRDLVKLPPREMRSLRGREISMIFQEPGTSLNPVFRVGDQVMETLRLHQGLSKADARDRTIELFEEVGIPEPTRRVSSYPHEMSGGQKQRVMIAMALSCNPRLLIADEPTTALDVTIQAQILDLIRKLRDERGMAILFITHDLGVIAEIADRIAVMYHGKIVERGTCEEIFTTASHPYTKGLLACRPRLSSSIRRLPTVSDFMRVESTEDGEELREATLDDAALEAITSRGRGRLLHPGSPTDGLKEGDRVLGDDIEPLLSVRNLEVGFPIRSGFLRRQVGTVQAVDGISFDIYPGQTVGLVGESGCGKTTTGLAILRLIEQGTGEIVFDGTDLGRLSQGQMRPLRRRLQIILQDPYASLNPRMTVESMLREAMKVHNIGTDARDRRDRALRLLEEVGLEPSHLKRYPHEFSGGQRQRVSIARALAVDPELVICDESVSALDVSVQAQVLNLLRDLQDERGLTYLFISHDLSVVKFMSDMMIVMNDGKIVESGPSDALYRAPQDPYTQRLIDSVPDDSLENIRRRRDERRAARDARERAAAS